MAESGTPKRMMNACPSCGEVIDVAGCEPFSKVLCPSCSAPIRVRGNFLNFQIKKRIGEGGMSRVFRAIDKTLDRQVALKILNSDFAMDAKRAREFEREAKITASISHPNVVKVYSAGRDQSHYFIAMELVPGGSLDEKISAEGAIKEAAVLKMAAELVEGLDAAHEAGLIHRDMKPGNVLFSNEGTSKIVDFGLALDLLSGDKDDGEIWATPYYVPPEKLYKEPEDFRSDIYSLGATLFHALAGKPPYSADTSSIEELKAIKDKPISLEMSAPKVSMATCELVDRMMARQPANRYSNYAELLEHVNFAQQQLAERGAGSSASATRRMRRKVEERRAVTAALVAFAVVAVVLGGVLGMHFNKRPKGTGSGTGTGGPGGGGTVIESGSTSERLEQARKLLIAKKFKQAERAFGSIASDAKAPKTANWALFNQGLSMLFQGKEAGSREIFKKLESDVSASEGHSHDLVSFFEGAGRLLGSALPVLPEHSADFNPTGPEALGLLACGLKNWELGAFAAAPGFLRTFRDAELEGQGGDDLRDLVRPYLHDFDKLKGFPPVARDAGFQATKAALKKARKIHGELLLAGVKARIQKRINRLDRLVARLEVEEREAKAGEMARLRGEESKRLMALLMRLEDYRTSPKVEEGLAILEAENFEHPEIKQRHDDELYSWRKAANFLATLIADLNRHGYTGSVERVGGTVTNWKIVGADRERITYQYGSATGEGKIPFSQLTDTSLLKIADALVQEHFSDMDNDVWPRRELRALFAYVVRDWGIAKRTADGLPKRDFPEFWNLWHRATEREDEL